MKRYAHSLEGEPERKWQSLEDHLANTAERAAQFMQVFDCASWGTAAGLLHDMGKASDAFQRRLHGSNEKVVHSNSGACGAQYLYDEDIGGLLSFVIAGHHGGMPNGFQRSFTKKGIEVPGSKSPLSKRLDSVDCATMKAELKEVKALLTKKGEVVPTKGELVIPNFLMKLPSSCNDSERGHKLAVSLYVFLHMLYSSLVDADYLDSESVMSINAADARGNLQPDSLEVLSTRLDSYMNILANGAQSSIVNQARDEVRRDSLDAAVLSPGLFSMSVPTGAGKTLASIAFALRHAVHYGMERVIISTPFMSVTDQSAKTLRKIFGEQNVLEHQSSYDFEDVDEEIGTSLRLAIQNWNMPIIVTTNVQLFESLFSNKPGKSRKVHNMAKSVIVLDEVQMIPDSLLKPTLAMIEVLSCDYGSSVVLCSATQPPLEGLWPFRSEPREIVKFHDGFAQAFKGRVSYENRGVVAKEDLVEELVGLEQGLCVVGIRKEARLLYEDMIELLVDQGCLSNRDEAASAGYFHLSAFMVPAHRLCVLDEVRERLNDGRRCVVVSTQLIEAGVDVDFPVVYRELAGMDSIVQVAGRCNREGTSGKGRVVIFELSVEGQVQKTVHWLESMKSISRDIIEDNGGIVNDDLVERFFRQRYLCAELDSRDVLKRMAGLKGPLEMQPEQIAYDYRFIEDDTVSVFVPWSAEGIQALHDIRSAKAPAGLFMKAQRYSVSIRKPVFDIYCSNGSIEQVPPFWILRVDMGGERLYDDAVGLLVPGEGVMDVLIS